MVILARVWFKDQVKVLYHFTYRTNVSAWLFNVHKFLSLKEI